MSKRIIAVIVAACAVFAVAPSLAVAQGDTGNRLADLESKVETLLRENASLRSRIGQLESNGPAGDQDEADLYSAIEEVLDDMAGDAGGGFSVRSGETSRMYVTGEARTRVDWRSNTADMTDAIDDIGLRLDYRFNLGFRFDFKKKELDGEGGLATGVSAYFEIQAAGRGANNTAENLQQGIGGAGAGQFEARLNDLDIVSLYQAYIDLNGILGVQELSTRIGRQELAYGSGLILGNNRFFTGTVHDSFRIDYSLTDYNVDFSFFYAKQAATDGQVASGLANGGLATGRFRASADEDVMLGLYTSIAPESAAPVRIDAYWVYFDPKGSNGNVRPQNVTSSADPGIDSFGRAVIGGREHHTLGLFVRGEDLFTEGLYMGAEFAFQTGDRDDGQDFNAFAVEAAVEYKTSIYNDYQLAAFVRYYYAQGPDSANDQGFTPLFIERHDDRITAGRAFSRLGNIDFIPTQNVHVIQFGLKFEPNADWLLGITYLTAWLDEGDAEFTVLQSGRVFVDDRHLGHEVDLYAQYTVNQNTKLFFNFSVFVPQFDFFFEDQNGGFNAVDSDVAVGIFGQVQVTF